MRKDRQYARRADERLEGDRIGPAIAADRILDRAYGRPPQFNTTDAVQFRRACDLIDDELAAIVTGGAAAAPPSSRRPIPRR